jgi:translocation and assembly module TamA
VLLADPIPMRHPRRALLAAACVLAWPAAAQNGKPGQPAAAPIAGPAAAAADAPAAVPAGTPGGSDVPGFEDFAPLPGGVPWPTVEATTAGEVTEVPTDVRYTVTITGLQPLGLDDEFRGLSALWTKRGDPANIAQINRRIAEDKDLIDQLLRSVGHYGGSSQAVVTPPARDGQPTQVAITVDPGPLYTFSEITVVAPPGATGPDPAKLVTPLLGVRPGDPVDAATVNSAQDALMLRLADAGYPFPVIGKPDITIDHESRTATMVQTVDLGPRGVFGSIRIEGETQGFSDAHVTMLARFKPGDPYTEAGRSDLRRALVQTGLFGSVAIKPMPSGEVNADGVQAVDLIVTTEAAPVRTIAASIGYSTDQGIRAEGSWTHRNFWKPEGALTIAGVAAQREQAFSVEMRRRNFHRRDQTLTLLAGLSSAQQPAYTAQTIGVSGIVNRESNIIWQKPVTYSIGMQLLATRQDDRSAATDPISTYFILAFPGTITWDRSDNFLNPSKGYRLTGRLSPEFTLNSGNNFNYLNTQIEATGYYPVGDLVIAGRVHIGGIVGADRGTIAPDRRFYAGGGGSVRGYVFQGIGPTDAEGVPTGGNSITEVAAELRYRFQAFGSDLGIVAFLDGGQVYDSSMPQFTDLRFGAGLGLRYFTSFGPVRIDVGTPIQPQPGDPRITLYVSIGQAF